MAGLGHIGFGFAAKPIVPKVHLVVLLIATELIDILWGIFYFTGIDRGNLDINSSPWSHSLFMSVIWSVIAALLAGRIYHDKSSGIIIGLLVCCQAHYANIILIFYCNSRLLKEPSNPSLPRFDDSFIANFRIFVT